VTHRPAATATPRRRATRRGGSLLALVLVGPLAGCYTTRPVTTAPVPGATVLLDLTDVARVEFGERIGGSASRIEGIVQSQNDTAYMLHISSVSYLDGRTNKWSGEPLTVPTRLVSRAQVREFSRSRTTLLGAAVAAALAVVFATTDFLGLGGGEKTPIPTPGGES
jgi:hypothetical protein